MALTIEEIYKAVVPLSASEKLPSARFLLNDIPSESVVECSYSWSKEDIREAKLHSLNRAEKLSDEDT